MYIQAQKIYMVYLFYIKIYNLYYFIDPIILIRPIMPPNDFFLFPFVIRKRDFPYALY